MPWTYLHSPEYWGCYPHLTPHKQQQNKLQTYLWIFFFRNLIKILTLFRNCIHYGEVCLWILERVQNLGILILGIVLVNSIRKYYSDNINQWYYSLCLVPRRHTTSLGFLLQPSHHHGNQTWPKMECSGQCTCSSALYCRECPSSFQTGVLPCHWDAEKKYIIVTHNSMRGK